MCTPRIFGLAVVALLTLGGRARAYTNQWAAHIDGGEEVARRVAEDYGFRYLGKVSITGPRPHRLGLGLSLFLIAFSRSCASGQSRKITFCTNSRSANKVLRFCLKRTSADTAALRDNHCIDCV